MPFVSGNSSITRSLMYPAPATTPRTRTNSTQPSTAATRPKVDRVFGTGFGPRRTGIGSTGASGSGGVGASAAGCSGSGSGGSGSGSGSGSGGGGGGGGSTATGGG